MYSKISVRWVRLSSFLVDSVTTVGFILIVIFGVLVHLLGLVGLPWSFWSLGETILRGSPGTAFGWLLAATAFCSGVFAVIWLIGILSGVLSGSVQDEDLTLLFKVVISTAVSVAGAILVLSGRAEIPGMVLFVPWINLGLWVWTLAEYS